LNRDHNTIENRNYATRDEGIINKGIEV